MKRILVIGIGNLIMKDDGIGVRVVNAVQSKLQEMNLASLIGETDVQYCLDHIRSDDNLIIVDAMIEGQEPGSVQLMSLNDAIHNRGKLRTQHEFSIFDCMALHYPKVQGYLIGIQAAEIDFGFELSEALHQRFEEICSVVLKTIETIKEEAGYA